MNFAEGNDRRKALSSISWVLDCTHRNVYIVSVETYKNIQSYDFIVRNPKWTQMQYCVGAKWTVCHHDSWGQSVQQHRRCEVVSRKAGHSFLAVHRPLISWHLDVNSCPQDFCPPTGRDDKCPTSPFVCTFGHESIKGLIAQLPYSTCPLDILLQLHVFIPPQPLVHRRAPSGPTSQSQVDTPSTAGRQQIKRLIHGHYHHNQKKTRETYILAFTTFTASKCRCLVSTPLYVQKKAEKKRVGHLSVIQRRFMIERPGQNTGVETKRLGSRVLSWLVKKSNRICTCQWKPPTMTLFPLFMPSVTIHLNAV